MLNMKSNSLSASNNLLHTDKLVAVLPFSGEQGVMHQPYSNSYEEVLNEL